MDKPKVGPKEFFLWAGAMVALYWSVLAFIFLIFDYINYALPDPLAYYQPPYSSGLPFDMASLLVMLPIYVGLAYAIRRAMRKEPGLAGLWVRRWAIILTIFVTGVTMAIDLVVLLGSFFRGEAITEAFALKVLLVFLVAAAGFMHFAADLWGYWQVQPARERAVAVAVLLLGILSIGAGFFIVGTPHHARLLRFDDQKVSDLQTLESQIVSYWQAKDDLPTSLADLSSSLSNMGIPTDPQTGAAYEYKTTGNTAFELCATFNAPTDSRSLSSAAQLSSPYSAGANDNWTHGAGRTCFTRTIDPAFYPPAAKPL